MGPSRTPFTVLVAPLDWGLGHATRCVPIVRALEQNGCRVVLAAEGKTAALLHTEFPHLRLLSLPGYRISYASSGWGLAPKIVAQIPKLFLAIKNEQAWLRKVVHAEKIDAVISDNRFGLHHPHLPSVFITHQLQIKAPLPAAEHWLQQLNYRFINRFSECWIPDAEGETNLAGELSHPARLPRIPVHYLGWLSRFQHAEETKGGDLLILLSGPEPQRSLFENRLLKELNNYRGPVTLVRGLPAQQQTLSCAENVTVFNHLPAADLQEKIRRASVVIARCGYSTVMDLAALKKRSILVPTPGQTEQQYLAQHLQNRRFALCIKQEKFRLKAALELAAGFRYQFPEASSSILQQTVARWVETHRKKV